MGESISDDEDEDEKNGWDIGQVEPLPAPAQDHSNMWGHRTLYCTVLYCRLYWTVLYTVHKRAA